MAQRLLCFQRRAPAESGSWQLHLCGCKSSPVLLTADYLARSVLNLYCAPESRQGWVSCIFIRKEQLEDFPGLSECNLDNSSLCLSRSSFPTSYKERKKRVMRAQETPSGCRCLSKVERGVENDDKVLEWGVCVVGIEIKSQHTS